MRRATIGFALFEACYDRVCSFLRRATIGFALFEACYDRGTGRFKRTAPKLFSIQCSRRFLEIDPGIWHAYFMISYPTADEWGFFLFFFFSPDMFF